MSPLVVIQEKVKCCSKCDELCSSRTQTVFADGNPLARIFLVGEAPGADEDRLGIPFVGRAGQLLTNILKSCGLERDDVYIANILKCRPPSNRNPTPQEAANCREYLDAQLEFVKPDYIVCLGTIAAQHLLGKTETITALRGQWHELKIGAKTAKVLCTYHPAYLLRQGQAAKQQVWGDLQMLLKELKDNPPQQETNHEKVL